LNTKNNPTLRNFEHLKTLNLQVAELLLDSRSLTRLGFNKGFKKGVKLTGALIKGNLLSFQKKYKSNETLFENNTFNETPINEQGKRKRGNSISSVLSDLSELSTPFYKGE
jgi:hypothetical protein